MPRPKLPDSSSSSSSMTVPNRLTLKPSSSTTALDSGDSGSKDTPSWSGVRSWYSSSIDMDEVWDSADIESWDDWESFDLYLLAKVTIIGWEPMPESLEASSSGRKSTRDLLLDLTK